MLDFLKWAGKFPAAAGASALFTCRGFLAHYDCLEWAWASCREMIFLLPARFVRDNINNLRDDVTGTLHHHGIPNTNVAPLAQLLAVAADTFDVILIVECDVLHDNATDTDRLQLAYRGKSAGAANLDFDTLEHGRGALSRKLVGDCPARSARDEAKSLLPVDTINFVDDAIDIVVELRSLFFDLAMEGDQLVGRAAEFRQRIGLEPAGFEPLDHAGLSLRRHFAHFAPRIGKKAQWS